MEIRPATPRDLPGAIEIDATIESHRYLHVERSGEGLNAQWKVEERPLRSRLIQPFPMDVERQFMFQQISGGIEDGLALVAEHDDEIVGLLLAQPRDAQGVLQVLDLRVDFDQRREGLAMALMFQAIQTARDAQHRAVMAETAANNFPAAQLLDKLGFHLGGLDTQRYSNHDLVKEAVTLIWYTALD
jgi:ribosomal protein S18 acetylase RimI-like enzyme